MIITHYQAAHLLLAKNKRLDSAQITLDLGITKSEVLIKEGIFIFPDNRFLDETAIKKIIKKDTCCFLIENNDIKKIEFFSQETNNYYKLFPTTSWPTMEISGIRMHVVKDMTPKEDTIKKISFVSPCTGTVLDTCTGLGYTAIIASKTADLVYTFEIDENCIALQELNPHSKELFESPKIKRHHGDIFEEIKKLPTSFFDRIIHDPPRLALSSLLYSQEFYKELFRVAKKDALLYHYTGNPGAKNRNVDLKKNVAKRLSIAGFVNVKEVLNGLQGKKYE
ncbi:MAG: hypothetical protein V1859_08865 [archaeon]